MSSDGQPRSFSQNETRVVTAAVEAWNSIAYTAAASGVERDRVSQFVADVLALLANGHLSAEHRTHIVALVDDQDLSRQLGERTAERDARPTADVYELTRKEQLDAERRLAELTEAFWKLHKAGRGVLVKWHSHCPNGSEYRALNYALADLDEAHRDLRDYAGVLGRQAREAGARATPAAAAVSASVTAEADARVAPSGGDSAPREGELLTADGVVEAVRWREANDTEWWLSAEDAARRVERFRDEAVKQALAHDQCVGVADHDAAIERLRKQLTDRDAELARLRASPEPRLRLAADELLRLLKQEGAQMSLEALDAVDELAEACADSRPAKAAQPPRDESALRAAAQALITDIDAAGESAREDRIGSIWTPLGRVRRALAAAPAAPSDAGLAKPLANLLEELRQENVSLKAEAEGHKAEAERWAKRNRVLEQRISRMADIGAGREDNRG